MDFHNYCSFHSLTDATNLFRDGRYFQSEVHAGRPRSNNDHRFSLKRIRFSVVVAVELLTFESVDTRNPRMQRSVIMSATRIKYYYAKYYMMENAEGTGV